MSTEDVSPEQLAKTFFHYHQALGPDFECSSAPRPQSWSDIPLSERNRMIAAARLVLLEIGHSKQTNDTDSSRYFAKPGSAEWGC